VAACSALAAAIAAMLLRGGGEHATRSAAAAVSARDIGGRPSTPPGPDAPHVRAPEPTMPALTPAWRRAVTAQVEDAARPGAQAFRAMSDLYVDANDDFARAQAAAERITVAEVRELTHLGLLVLATQRVAEVEDVLGHELDDEDRTALGELMRTSNQAFKTELRALVASGAGEDARWQLIRATEADYLAGFVAITGLDDDGLDALLGGNILLPGAPIAEMDGDGPGDRDGDGDGDGDGLDEVVRDRSPATPPRPTAPGS
jgi:hypothetical protein